MKRMYFVLLLPLVMSNCSKEERSHNIELQTTSKTLFYEDEYKIVAESKDPITYTSSDEYHATVSKEGIITAGHVGETTIILNNSHDTKILNLYIKPRLVLYKDPFLKFGTPWWSVINELGEPDDQTYTSFAYNLNSDVAPLIMYTFDNYDNLEYVTVLVSSSRTDDLVDYLLERYIPVSISDLVFVNALTADKTSMFVKLELYNSFYWMIIYANYPGSGTKSEEWQGTDIDIDEIRKAMEVNADFL